MKPKKIISIAAIIATAGILGLAGCKPKPTTLTAQVFIVTKGAENVKLGDVEILLIEKSWMTNYLETRQPTIESMLEAKQQEIKNGTYLQCYKTNADYINISSDYHTLQAKVENLQADWDTFNKQENTAQTKEDAWAKQCALYPDSDVAQKHYSDAKDEVALLLEKMTTTTDQTQPLVDEMKPLVNQMDVIRLKVTSTEKEKLENHPTPADYFEDFSPAIAQKTTTDSDGKFYLSYPSKKAFTIFAHAQRLVLDKTETYYWLVDAPTGTKTAQILLSNNNLVFADPDGYFKIKPKEEQQDTTAP